ncbi:hypothetical protein EVAR_50971_1 [Eumeta japonica]|uniref:Uncharacterized protein n=1 Tax=Eumeta variegata TaxID=151549 RepID=A0A4C1XEC9_EUMVA|nr:hypothetical protein EVAR_50971_1 [Eumeta japonica]
MRNHEGIAGLPGGNGVSDGKGIGLMEELLKWEQHHIGGVPSLEINPYCSNHIIAVFRPGYHNLIHRQNFESVLYAVEEFPRRELTLGAVAMS